MTLSVLRKHSGVKGFCITFTLIVIACQVESLPAYNASAQGPQNTPSPSVTVQAVLSNAETAKSNQDSDHASDQITKAEWVQIGVNSILALIVFWQAWIYNQQKKQTRIAERGYIGIKSIDLIDFQVGKQPYLKVVFLNGGRTPVWNFYSPAHIIVDVEPPPSAPPKPEGETGAFLPAGATGKSRYPFGRVIDGQMVREIETGHTKLFFRGEAWFDDCWGETRSYPFYLIYDPRSGGFEEYKEYAKKVEVVSYIKKLP